MNYQEIAKKDAAEGKVGVVSSPFCLSKQLISMEPKTIPEEKEPKDIEIVKISSTQGGASRKQASNFLQLPSPGA